MMRGAALLVARTRRAAFLVAGLGALALAVFALSTEADASAIACVLATLGAVWLATAALDDDRTAPPLDRGAALLGVGGATLCLQLTCRLGAAAHFGGRWQRFDFGVKCAKDEADCDERNRAFTPHFNSFGHCAQGALSALLVPSVERALAARVVGGRAGVVAASSFVAAYPAYN